MDQERQAESSFMSSNKPKPLYSTFSELFLHGFKIDWLIAGFITITHIVLLLGTPLAYWFAPEGFWKIMLGWTLVHALVGCLSTTVYSHRLVSHGAANKIRWPVHIVFGYIGQVFAIQGSVLHWAAMHVMHHGVDRSGKHHLDPYSATWFDSEWRNFLWSHMLTYFFSHPEKDAKEKAIASKSTPLLVWQDKLYVPLLIAWNFILPLVLGFVLTNSIVGSLCLMIASIGGFILAQHNTWTVNSVTHMWGTTKGAISSAKNNYLWMGPLGEGNHHADHHDHGKDYRNGFGVSGWLLDPTRYVILFLRLVGLVKGLQRASKAQEAKIVAKRKMDKLKHRLQLSKEASLEKWNNLEKHLDQRKADWVAAVDTWEKYKKQRRTLKQQLLELRAASRKEKCFDYREALLAKRNALSKRFHELKWEVREAKLKMRRSRQDFFATLQHGYLQMV